MTAWSCTRALTWKGWSRKRSCSRRTRFKLSPTRSRKSVASCASTSACGDVRRARGTRSDGPGDSARAEGGGPPVMRRLAVALGLCAAGLAILILTGWGAMVLYYLGPGSAGVRRGLAWTFVALGAATVVALAARRGRRIAAVAFGIGLVAVVVCWTGAKPSNSRDWQPEVAVLPWAE